jgi:hypothetical protein
VRSPSRRTCPTRWCADPRRPPSRPTRSASPGSVGLLAVVDGHPTSVFSPAIRDGRIVEISIVADPDRLAGLDLRGVL